MRQMGAKNAGDDPIESITAAKNTLSAADEANSDSLAVLTQAGNTIQELTKKQPDIVDNSQQIMDEIYKINQR